MAAGRGDVLMKDAVAALQELNPDIERNLKVQAAVAR